MLSPRSLIPLSAVKDTAQLSKLIVSGAYIHEVEEACQALRLTLSHLFPRKLDDFLGEGVSPDVAEIRFEHYEKKRQYRLNKLLRVLTDEKAERGPPRNRSQDLTRLRKLNTDCLLLGPRNRYGGQSVSPSNHIEDLPPSPKDLAEISFSDASTCDRRKSNSERRMLVQERSLQLRLAEIKDKINRLKAKESRFEHAKEELRAAEVEKQKKREMRSSKIRDNLEKKYKQLEAFEKREARRGLLGTPDEKAAPSRSAIPAIPSKAALENSDDEELLERQMKHIQEKMESSAARASQQKTLKALAHASKHDYHRKAQERVRAEEASKEQELLHLAAKLQEQQTRSLHLREQHLQAILEKTANSNRKKQEKRRSEDKRRSLTIRPEDTKEREAERAKFDILRQERANLKRMDVEENLSRERTSLLELKESILHKHKHLASTVERRLLERSVQHQSLLKEDFQRQVQRERVRDAVTGKICELHSRFLRTIDA